VAPRTRTRRLLAVALLAALAGLPVLVDGGPPAEAARPSTTAARMVAIAQAELRRGVREVPLGSNRGSRIRMYGASTRPRFYPAPWCAYFVSWVARRAGAPLGPSGQGFGYVPYIRAWAQRTGRWRRQPRSGDLVMFPQHVGLVERVYRNGTLTTIEGNSSNRVARRFRRWGEASGYVRVAGGGTVVRRAPTVRERTATRPRTPSPLHARISIYPATTVAAGQKVGFSANDSSGDIVRYAWDLDGDGRFDDGRGDNAERAYAKAGTVRVGLKVTDRAGRARVARRTVTVHDNKAPVARLDLPAAARVGEKVTGDASASHDPDGRIARYEWDLDGDGRWEDGERRRSVTFRAPGVYTAGLRVVDDRGARTETIATIHVTAAPPVAKATGPGRVGVGEEVAFDGSRSGGDGRVVAWRWDFDADGVPDAEGVRPLWRYAAPGARSVRLVVVDEWGAAAETTHAVDVVNQAPTAVLLPPARPVAGREALFDASPSSDPDSRIAAYEWDFDDDGRWDASGAQVRWRFATHGRQTVRLRVTDEFGAARTASARPLVLAPPRPAIAVTGGALVAGSPVTLGAAGSWDPDGRIDRLDWDLDGDGRTDATTWRPTHPVTATYARAGDVTARVTVTDDDGLQETASVRLAIRAAS
jgi:PKD repeat protein